MILSFSYSSTVNAALSATTANTIQGTKPFINFNGVAATDLNALLSFNMPDGTPVTPLTTGQLNIAPTATFSQVTTLVTADGGVKNLSTVSGVTYDDNDGDTAHATAPVGGTLTAKWTYKAPDNSIKTLSASDLSGHPDACKAPYTLTIAASSVKAQSAYGDPIDNNYGSQTKAYTINVTDYKKCYIQPASLDVITYCTSLDCKYASGYNSAVFVPKGGFLPDASPAFPTVGFNKAKFTLKMSNAQSDYTYSSNSTVAPIDSNGVVTLTSETRPSLDLDVTLTATPKDTTYPAQTYSFTIKKWPKAVLGKAQYNTSIFTGTYPAATLCDPTLSSLSGSSVATQAQAAAVFYSRAELTNTKYATGTSAGGFFSRDIDGTFMGEWGNLNSSYTGSGFEVYHYIWSSFGTSTLGQFGIHSNDGYVNTGGPNGTGLAVCR